MVNYPILLDTDGKPQAVLANALAVMVKDQILTLDSGFETLEIKLFKDDSRASLIHNEDLIEVGGRHYITRMLSASKTDESILNVMCDATWYDLNDYEDVGNLIFANVGPATIMAKILEDTDWTVGTVEITTPRDYSQKDLKTPLASLRQLPQVYGGELRFRTKEKKVDLLEQVGDYTDVMFSYEKNMDEINRTIDTRNLVTRLRLVGAAGITIAPINNGIDYLEDYSYYDNLGKPRKLKAYTHKDERFSNPNYMKYWMQNKLPIISQPTVGYTVKVSILDGNIPNLGDYVKVHDKDLGLNGFMRVMGRSINRLSPEDSDIQLDRPVKTLADQLGGDTGAGGTADVTSAVQNVMSDATMFNLLFNSRGDDGFAYWINQGFGIDNTAGVSGTSAFTVDGQYGYEKSLTQTVDVANRTSYTISAEMETNNIVKGTNGKVGFEVTFEFDDGTTEVQWVPIA